MFYVRNSGACALVSGTRPPGCLEPTVFFRFQGLVVISVLHAEHLEEFLLT